MRQWFVLLCAMALIFVSVSPSQARSWRTESPYPRMRNYLTPKDPALAGAMSTVFPGMGQMYAGQPGKGILFLVAEAALFTAAAVQIDRAVYYDDYADRYDVFYDDYTNDFLTFEQGYNRSRGHGIAGAGLLLAGIGVHVWNIQDAVTTAQRYNHSRRLTLDVRPMPEPQLALHVRF